MIPYWNESIISRTKSKTLIQSLICFWRKIATSVVIHWQNQSLNRIAITSFVATACFNGYSKRTPVHYVEARLNRSSWSISMSIARLLVLLWWPPPRRGKRGSQRLTRRWNLSKATLMVDFWSTLIRTRRFYRWAMHYSKMIFNLSKWRVTSRIGRRTWICSNRVRYQSSS